MTWRVGFGTLLVVSSVACGGEGTHSPAQGGSGREPLPQSGQAGQDAAGGASGTAATAGGTSTAGTGAGTGGASQTGGGGAGGGEAGGGGAAGGASSAGQGGMLTTPEALAPIAQSFCAAAQACCSKEGLPSKLGSCESSYASQNETAQALARGTVTLDAAGLARCLAAYQSAAETCEELSVRSACQGVARGTRGVGESCLIGLECAGDEAKACLVADGNPGTVGVCKKIPHGKVGDPCDITCRPDDSCTWTTYGASAADQPPTVCFEAEGVYCDLLSDTPTCQAIHAPGTACDDFDQCGSAGDCDVDTHTCLKLGQLGDSCGRCIPQLSCIDGKCKSPSFTVGGTCDGYSFGP